MIKYRKKKDDSSSIRRVVVEIEGSAEGMVSVALIGRIDDLIDRGVIDCVAGDPQLDKYMILSREGEIIKILNSYDEVKSKFKEWDEYALIRGEFT